MSKKNCVCNERLCGTNIDLAGLAMNGDEDALVYLDKVFSLNRDTSCPVIFHLNTAECPENFTITFESLDRNCDPCPIGPDAVFHIRKACATLEFIETEPPGNICPDQVLVDGQEVDHVDYENGRYTVDIASILPSVVDEECEERGLPTKVFFLIKNVCAWQIRITFILEGTVNSGGQTCKFRAVFSNAVDAPPIVLPTGCCSSFAVPKLAIPSELNGNVPTIAFRFDGTVKLVNPKLKVICRMPGSGPRPFDAACCDPFPPGPGPGPGPISCMLTLCSKVVLEPTLIVETVRRTLFQINANQVLPESMVNNGNSVGGVTNNPCVTVGGVFDSPCNDVGGVEEECQEICEEFCNQVGGVWNCPDVFGTQTGRRRTAFQFNGNNGCCW